MTFCTAYVRTLKIISIIFSMSRVDCKGARSQAELAGQELVASIVPVALLTAGAGDADMIEPGAAGVGVTYSAVFRLWMRNNRSCAFMA